jgi:DNA-binding NarL/FixJ family response regulator
MGEGAHRVRAPRLSFLPGLADQRLAVLSVPLATADAAVGLTEAESDVVTGLLQGLSNREIAARRGSSARTVANQVATVFRKLGVRSRAELAAALMRGGGLAGTG